MILQTIEDRDPLLKTLRGEFPPLVQVNRKLPLPPQRDEIDREEELAQNFLQEYELEIVPQTVLLTVPRNLVQYRLEVQ